MYPQVTLREFFLGLALFVTVTLIGIPLALYVRAGAQRRYIAIQQSLKVGDATQMSYAIKTNVGNILAYGPVVAVHPQSLSDIKGEYAVIAKIKEVYTMHTYETCSGKPTVCTTHTYWSWDYAGEEKKQSDSYNVVGSEVSNICQPDTSIVSLSSHYTGSDHHNDTYAYQGVGTRYYWKQAPVDATGSVFLRAFQGKITNPFNSSCIPYYHDVSIEQAVKNYRPANWLITLVCFFTIILITGIYFYEAYTEDIC